VDETALSSTDCHESSGLSHAVRVIGTVCLLAGLLDLTCLSKEDGRRLWNKYI
jgi:hypothetical protein